MASPRPKGESFDFEEAMGSASASYSSAGGVFGLSPPESSPRDSRKRRKDRPSWVKHTFTPHFDGHLWRKYGQKNIKDSAFPRLYYRCSYREDKQCLASKLVQQENNDDPPLFRVTYTYEHTCNAAPVPTPDVVAELPAPTADSLFLRFDSTGASNGDRHRMEQQRQYQQPMAPGWPSLMLSFESNSQPHTHHAAFPSELPPVASTSTPFSADGMLQATPLPSPAMTTDGGGDRFSTWDSLKYGLNDHVHFGDNRYLADNNGNDDNY
ncbi:probable WRKY transcription factor 62 [Lolium rigidum]|uniref:probable WRKY transcription factor 62 n=1 Tax=Lolium rigidum TaxID=89674 RepID=UPI001F5C898C|nr:probable WRKY transcription factor 62 [Lolium rigidum]